MLLMYLQKDSKFKYNRLSIGEIEKTAGVVLCQGNPLIMKGLRLVANTYLLFLFIVITISLTIIIIATTQAGAAKPCLLWDDAVQGGETTAQ